MAAVMSYLVIRKRIGMMTDGAPFLRYRLRNHDFMPLWIIGILRIEDGAPFPQCRLRNHDSMPLWIIGILRIEGFGTLGFQNQLLQVLPQDGTVIIWTVAKEGDLWEAKVLKDFNTSLTGNIRMWLMVTTMLHSRKKQLVENGSRIESFIVSSFLSCGIGFRKVGGSESQNL
ncbi:hypothetical protein C5167_040131 [Papaver somniferum]|uniref:Uncharacterized protein n=1 Tax=Papaver somniferum TaxID=3469 RepID=A0A4Y7IE11_PAPSO|nr:hypothetical protein C5167_040131 [Papaver somniferum]